MPDALRERASMLRKWYDGRSGYAATERRLWRLVSVVRAMSFDEAAMLEDEVERFAKDCEEVAATLRKTTRTLRRVAALRSNTGRTPEEAAMYEAKARALFVDLLGADETRWPDA